MYKERIIALCCGIVACILVIMSGKSCMGNPVAEKSKSASTQTSEEPYSIVTPELEKNTMPPSIGYDFFGKPIYYEIPSNENNNGDTESEQEEILPDIDLTTATEPTFSTESSDDEQSDNQEKTTAVSDEMENYTTKPTIPPGFDGNDHRVYDHDGQEIITLPSDFVIIID